MELLALVTLVSIVVGLGSIAALVVFVRWIWQR